MSSKSSKQGFSKKILAILADKPAIRVSDLMDAFSPQKTRKSEKYAFNRSLKGLEEAGLVASYDTGRDTYTKITKEGKKKAHSIRLENDTTLVNPSWDGKWRIILLDLPEERKSEREGLRYLLKKAGFVMLKNSVWISPLPYEHLFGNIKKDLGLTNEMMILVTDMIDELSEQAFLRSFGK